MILQKETQCMFTLALVYLIREDNCFTEQKFIVNLKYSYF